MATTYEGVSPLEITAPGAGEDTRVRVMLVSSADATVGATGVLHSAVTATVCKPGTASFSTFPTWGTDNWTELGNGWYEVIIRNSDADELALLDTHGDWLLHVEATACEDADVLRRVVPADAARDDQWTDTRASQLDNLDAEISALPTAAENADAVWDEATAGHTTAGTFGAWATGLVAAVWAYTTRTITSWIGLIATVSESTVAAITNRARQITMYYGDNAPIEVTVTTADGSAYDLTGAELTLAIVSAETDDWDAALVTCDTDDEGGITVTSPAEGQFTIEFTDAQLEVLTYGAKRWYSIKIETSAGTVRQTLLSGRWAVEAAQDRALTSA